MSNQGLRQASAQSISAFVGATTYEEAFMRLFDAETIPAGPFNERMLRWINARLASDYTSLPSAQAAFAQSLGLTKWDDVGTFV